MHVCIRASVQSCVHPPTRMHALSRAPVDYCAVSTGLCKPYTLRHMCINAEYIETHTDRKSHRRSAHAHVKNKYNKKTIVSSQQR